MFRNAIGKFSGLCGMAADVLDAAIFSSIPQGVLLTSFFKPLGGLMAGATLMGPCVEEKTDKRFFKLLGYLPAATANVAIFALEGPAVAYVFTAAIGASGAIMVTEVAYKAFKGEEVNKVDLLIRTGKIASILLTLNYGGTGKVFELLKSNSLTVVHKAASYAASAFSAMNAVMGLGVFGKACCGSESKSTASNQEGYTELEAQTELVSPRR